MQRFSILAALACATCALGAPPLGGPMNHVHIQLVGNQIHLSVDVPDVPMVLDDPGVELLPPEDVLQGASYNAQYGWLVGGLWSPPPGSGVWIEQLDATPELASYIGRSYMTYDAFEPIFGTDGASPRIRWDGVMLHNYYATSSPGEYQATYLVYIGDASGNPTPGYKGGTVTLMWSLVSDACGPADVTTTGATAGEDQFGSPDGVVDLSDLLYFVTVWNNDRGATSDSIADVTTTGATEGHPSFGSPDGQVDLSDLLHFVNVWSSTLADCP